MTTKRETIERYICDYPGCKREAAPGGSFWDDDHLCIIHRTQVSQKTMDDLREAVADCLRESHEGGTQHLPKAMIAYANAWNKASTRSKPRICAVNNPNMKGKDMSWSQCEPTIKKAKCQPKQVCVNTRKNPGGKSTGMVITLGKDVLDRFSVGPGDKCDVFFGEDKDLGKVKLIFNKRSEAGFTLSHRGPKGSYRNLCIYFGHLPAGVDSSIKLDLTVCVFEPFPRPENHQLPYMIVNLPKELIDDTLQ